MMENEWSCFTDGCPADWAGLPIPDGRIAIGLDGRCVRNWDDRKTNFEVIVGQSVPEDRDPATSVCGHERGFRTGGGCLSQTIYPSGSFAFPAKGPARASFAKCFIAKCDIAAIFFSMHFALLRCALSLAP